MKFIYLFILINLSSNCFSQTSSPSLKNTFTLNGQLKGRDTGRMILSYQQDSTNNWRSNTTWLKNGKFTFEGFIDQPTLGILGDPKYVDGGSVNSVFLFLEPKKNQLKTTQFQQRARSIFFRGSRALHRKPSSNEFFRKCKLKPSTPQNRDFLCLNCFLFLSKLHVK